ncbi:hypothetical protein LO762_09715 [Actinocorallia sp. API 0066]|uniref:hypothetical protein n=1 Tax=Actinocorallia sp. API 0066 TaxID=2896846 RepID=UPI001E5E1BB9|nr:hypothetical protein [Actinocorallia sp. API 0066]MCD0449465.1 hypothetical protein [Actinocorallia sp. API 0066]
MTVEIAECFAEADQLREVGFPSDEGFEVLRDVGLRAGGDAAPPPPIGQPVENGERAKGCRQDVEIVGHGRLLAVDEAPVQHALREPLLRALLEPAGQPSLLEVAAVGLRGRGGFGCRCVVRRWNLEAAACESRQSPSGRRGGPGGFRQVLPSRDLPTTEERERCCCLP